MALNIFKLEKLQIEAYNCAGRSGSPAKTFKVMFNPQSVSQKYANSFEQDKSSERRFKGTSHGDLSLDIILDGTHASQFGAERLFDTKSVSDKIEEFLDVTHDTQGKTHEPYYLKISWGKLNMGYKKKKDFSCRLADVSINYTLFDRDASPLRATLSCNFIYDELLEDVQKADGKSSPDLTHVRMVKAGDNILLKTADIYSDPLLYLEVARVNRINNFRRLKSGQSLKFPPVQ